MLGRAVSYKFADVSTVLTASIIRVDSLLMSKLITLTKEAASFYESSAVFFQTALPNIPEDGRLNFNGAP
jgi:hypothetical protein